MPCKTILFFTIYIIFFRRNDTIHCDSLYLTFFHIYFDYDRKLSSSKCLNLLGLQWLVWTCHFCNIIFLSVLSLSYTVIGRLSWNLYIINYMALWALPHITICRSFPSLKTFISHVFYIISHWRCAGKKKLI